MVEKCLVNVRPRWGRNSTLILFLYICDPCGIKHSPLLIAVFKKFCDLILRSLQARICTLDASHTDKQNSRRRLVNNSLILRLQKCFDI